MSKKKKVLGKYYILVLPILFFSIIFLKLIDASFFNLIFFVVSFLWQVLLRAPYIEPKVTSRKMRFSFLKLIYSFNEFLINNFAGRESKIKESLIRMASPIMFVALLILISNEGNILYGVTGCLISEIILWNQNSRVAPDYR